MKKNIANHVVCWTGFFFLYP